MSESKLKIKNKKLKIQTTNARIFTFLICVFNIWFFIFGFSCFAQEEFIYDARGKRNPFIPLVTSSGRLLNLDKEETKSGDLIIEGIIYDKFGRSFAIVNGSVVGVGDLIEDYQVLKVEEKKVIFIKEGVLREVTLSKEE